MIVPGVSMKQLGFDIGSLSLSSALIEDGKILAVTHQPHQGKIQGLLESLAAGYAAKGFDTVGIAGSILSGKNGIIDPTLAVIEGGRLLYPPLRNVLSIGGAQYF